MTDEPDAEFLYRAVDTQYAGPCDEYGEPTGYPGPIGVRILALEILKRTPCGAWIWDYEFSPDRRRFVNLQATKRYACPTKKEALESLAARRRRQAGIYEARAVTAREVARIAERMIKTGTEESFYGRDYNLGPSPQ